MSSRLPYWIAFAIAMTSLYAAAKWWQLENRARDNRSAGGVVTKGPPLTSFELEANNGQPFRSQDMLGKVWAVSFFFTSCPGSCTRLNKNIQHLHNLEELRDITWVSISVDPDTDDLATLNAYAERFQADPARWLFCRGKLDYIRRIGSELMKVHVSYKGHQDYVVVIDREGKTRGMFNATSRMQSQKLRDLLLECLSEVGGEETGQEL